MMADYNWDYANTEKAELYIDEQERGIINEFLDNHNPELYLDASWGSGCFSRLLLERWIRFTDDINPVPLNNLSNKVSDKWDNDEFDILQIDAVFSPVQDKVFDFVLLEQTLYYLNILKIISECNRILRNCMNWLSQKRGSSNQDILFTAKSENLTSLKNLPMISPCIFFIIQREFPFK